MVIDVYGFKNHKERRMDHMDMLDTLQMVLVWGIIFAVAIWYFKPVIKTFFLMRKNNVGLTTTKELLEIEELLRQCPWREEQELRLNRPETGNPYLQLNGYYTVLFVHVKDGVLTCSSGPITSLRKSYLELYEANQLLQYISRLLTATKDIAKMIAEETRIQFQVVLQIGRAHV